MMPQTPDTQDHRPEHQGASERRAAIYPLIDVDPDFHIPARREGALTRMLVALRILPQAS
ncbi:hypothetical protein [Microbacterium sp. MYb64]|uniref:hypothetical protein n=1 Tax=Microbacterium sp. MYb64 TaxID=1848691 RepID=UPI000CFC93FA|nr:hypothetical protein [Microbacterium sp. MYb64]PRB07545.1 hypothetical protein CQ044_05525 [Microbacterium sp. MYb64]